MNSEPKINLGNERLFATRNDVVAGAASRISQPNSRGAIESLLDIYDNSIPEIPDGGCPPGSAGSETFPKAWQFFWPFHSSK